VFVDNWGLKDALAILQFVLMQLVASIPVAMPTVFSVTIALGDARALQAEGDRLQALRHRGDGGRRYPVLGHDRYAHQEPAHAQRPDPAL